MEELGELVELLLLPVVPVVGPRSAEGDDWGWSATAGASLGLLLRDEGDVTELSLDIDSFVEGALPSCSSAISDSSSGDSLSESGADAGSLSPFGKTLM
jgi:hypothetical protein